MRRGRVGLIDTSTAQSDGWVSSAREALQTHVTEHREDAPLADEPALAGLELTDPDAVTEWIGSLTGRVSTVMVEPARAAAESTAAAPLAEPTPVRLTPTAVSDLRIVLEDEVEGLLVMADDIARSAASLHQDASVHLESIVSEVGAVS